MSFSNTYDVIKKFKGNLKWLIKSEKAHQNKFFILALYVYDFLFQNYKLLQISFFHCFYIVVGTKIDVNTQIQ